MCTIVLYDNENVFVFRLSTKLLKPFICLMVMHILYIIYMTINLKLMFQDTIVIRLYHRKINSLNMHSFYLFKHAKLATLADTTV